MLSLTCYLSQIPHYGDGEGNTLEYGYDEANNLATITYPDEKTVTYGYDSYNRLASVTDWANRVTTYAYDLAGRLKTTTRPNGTVRTQIHDTAGQLRFIEERNAAGELLWMRGLEYDQDGRITKTFTSPSNAGDYQAANGGDTASYDGDNRIENWTLGAGGAIECVFDADGNLLSGPSPEGAATALAYAYDIHNRLIGVGGQVLYRYSPDGHLVEADGVEYVVDPNAALSRILMRKEGSDVTYYVWGLGLVYEVTGDATKTYHADHLGSTMLLTDDDGEPTGEYFEYDSYGTPVYTAGNPTTPFRWHGTLGVTTEASGLLHMRARFYHTRIMRFLNEDPIGFEGGMNWFAFADGNPMSYTDPAGLCAGYTQAAWESSPIKLPNAPNSVPSIKRSYYDSKAKDSQRLEREGKACGYETTGVGYLESELASDINSKAKYSSLMLNIHSGHAAFYLYGNPRRIYGSRYPDDPDKNRPGEMVSTISVVGKLMGQVVELGGTIYIFGCSFGQNGSGSAQELADSSGRSVWALTGEPDFRIASRILYFETTNGVRTMTEYNDWKSLPWKEFKATPKQN